MQNIQIPFKPTNVLWKKNKIDNSGGRISGPNDYNIIAIATFSDEQFIELKSKFKDMDTINHKVYLNNKFIESWFPESIKGSFYLEESYNRINFPVYSAKGFRRPPYVDGICFFTENNEVFIYMYTT